MQDDKELYEGNTIEMQPSQKRDMIYQKTLFLTETTYFLLKQPISY